MNSGQLAGYLLKYNPAGQAEDDYEAGRITVEDFEQVLDAVWLHRGLDVALHCPRCGSLVKGIGVADGGHVAVRCTNTVDCHFVGYAEYPVHA